MIETTYANFINLKRNRGLTVGEEYRITDYVTKVKSDYVPDYINFTTIQCFRSAEHQFDVVVTATSVNSVSPYAKAMGHSGDTYFSGAQLSEWSLYYVDDLVGANGEYLIADKIHWAPTNEEGGKGAILWMRDEYGNEAHYDFKNIQFLRKAIVNSPSIREDANERSVAFFPKIRSEYDTAGYTGANKGLTYHIWQGYVEESEIASLVDYLDYHWGDIYTLSEEGTRIFCIMDDDSEGYIIAEVSSTDTWCYTYSCIHSDNSVTDASLNGQAANCKINIRQLDMVTGEGESDEYYLPGSVILLQENETAGYFFVYADTYFFNTHTGNTNKCEIDNYTISSLFNNGWDGAVLNANYRFVLCKRSMLVSYVTDDVSLDVIENDYKVIVKTLTFKSFDNKTYTVDIYGTSDEDVIGDMMLEGNAVHLQENNDNDFFKSLRVQTGYLYLTNASVATLLQLIPLTNMQRPLVIKENGTLIWTGFLKPQQFNMQYTAMIYERANLPIACQLSMIKGENFKPNTDTQYMSIGRMILLVIAAIASNTPKPFKNIVFDYGEQMIGDTQYVAGSDAWLQASVSPGMFYSYKENIPEAKVDMQSMLESLCTFLGMICRTEGDTIYFMAMDDSQRGRNMRKVTYQQLFGIVNGVYATGSSVSITEKNIFGTSDEINRYAGTDNTMLMKEGTKKAVITCKKQDTSLTFEWPESDVANELVTTSPTTRYDNITDSNINVFAERTTSFRKKTDNATYEVDFIAGSWYMLVYDPDTSAIGNLNPRATVRCNQPCYRYVVGDIVHWTYQYGAIRVYTDNSYIFNNCIIAVNFSLKFAEEINGTGPIARIYVKIGNQYYREASATIVNSTQIQTNRQKYSGDANYSGYGFKIDSSTLSNGKDFVNGKLEVGILYIRAYRYESGTYTFPAVEISDFSVQIVPNERLGVKYQDKYEVESSGTGKEYTKDTMFIKGEITSHLDNAIIGVDKFVSSTESDNNYNSCGYFAQRIANYYKRARRLYKVIVKRSMVNAKPTDIFVDSPDGAKYTPISIENDFRNDRQKILLAEIDD